MAGFFAYAAVWQASVQIGIGTWWVGPRADPSPAYVRIIPFALVLAMTLLVIYNTPKLPQTSVIGAALAGLIALPDLSRSVGLGVAELVIAALFLLASLTSFTGRYRLGPRRSSPSTPVPVAAPPADEQTRPWEPPTAPDFTTS